MRHIAKGRVSLAPTLIYARPPALIQARVPTTKANHWIRIRQLYTPIALGFAYTRAHTSESNSYVITRAYTFRHWPNRLFIPNQLLDSRVYRST